MYLLRYNANREKKILNQISGSARFGSPLTVYGKPSIFLTNWGIDRTNMKSHMKGVFLTSALLLELVLLLCYTNSASSQNATSTNQWRITSQPKAEEEGPVVAKDGAGNTTVFGDYDTKQTSPNGKVLQWYQGFADANGKCVIDIIRAGAGDDVPTHDGIQLITYRIYRPDGNIAEKIEFFGNGPIRQHVIYRYSNDGKWLKGDIYDEKGTQIGSELTKPEVYMYGENRKAQQ
jgi:hypothetical protein